MNARRQTIVIIILSLVLPCRPAPGEEPELEAAWNAVVAKYPTPGELRQRVQAYKSEHAAEFDSAKADFDSAVRAMVGLDFPLSPAQKQKHSQKRPELPALKTRDAVVRAISYFRSENSLDALRCAEFYEAHFEEIALERTPAHRYVYLDCLLNGWQDWSAWTTSRLTEVRAIHPDVHLKYAFEQLFQMRSQLDYAIHRDFIPTLLETLGNQSFGSETHFWGEALVSRLVQAEKDQDVMKYCFLKFIATQDRDYLSVFSSIDERLPIQTRRAFWQPYLEYQDEYIRVLAVESIGETIRKPRAGEDSRPEDAALAERLRQLADNDPSPRVKAKAQYKLRLYDTSDTRPTHGRLGVPDSQ